MLDYGMWVVTINRTCTTRFFDVSVDDPSDEQAKWLNCGITDNGQLFVRMGEGDQSRIIELFSKEDLQHFSKDGKRLIAKRGTTKDENKDTSGWMTQADFVVKDGVVIEIELAAKANPDPRPTIKKMGIKLTATGIEQSGSATVIQTGEISMTEQKYDLPSPVFEGKTFPDPPDLDEKTRAELEEKKAKDKKNKAEIKSEGSLPLTLTQKFDTEADQGRQYEGRFLNEIVASFEMLNRGDTVLVINKWKAEFQRGQEWVECDVFRRGQRGDRFNYHWERDPTASVTINSKHPEMISFSGGIYVKAKQAEANRRVHQSLPNPISVKFTLFEVNGGSVSIIVTFENPPLKLATKTSVVQGKRSAPGSDETRVDIGYLQCDDTELESRSFIDCFRNDGGSWGRNWVVNSNYFYSRMMYEKELNKLAYAAASEGKSEVMVKEFTSLEDGIGLTTHMLVDQKLRRGYAFRFSIVTNTGKATRHFLMWPK